MDECDDWLARDDSFEKDRFGDIQSEGERAGVSCDGEGEAERVGETLADGIFSRINRAIVDGQRMFYIQVGGLPIQRMLVKD